MNKSFYHYMMKYRHGRKTDSLTQLATKIYEDYSFPKQSSDYDEISSYLELNGLLMTMAIFDEAWDYYVTEA